MPETAGLVRGWIIHSEWHSVVCSPSWIWICIFLFIGSCITCPMVRLEAACFVQAPNRLGYQTCCHNYHINTVRIAKRGINDPEGPLRAENMAQNAYFSEI